MKVVQMKYYPKEVYYESRGNVHYIVLVYENSKVEHVIAAQQPLAMDVCRATDGKHVWITAADYGEVCASCGTRH